jgi:hypothetical protein
MYRFAVIEGGQVKYSMKRKLATAGALSILVLTVSGVAGLEMYLSAHHGQADSIKLQDKADSIKLQPSSSSTWTPRPSPSRTLSPG